jgi:tryptophan synthase beta chain
MTTTRRVLSCRRLSAPPDVTGRFGEFGGRFVPETLVPACQELEAAFDEAWTDPAFRPN